MDVLKPSKCLVELEIKNNDIDYGRIGVDDIVQTEPRPLTIIVRNLKYGADCPSVKLRGYFDNVRDLTNRSYIPVFDESGKEIKSYGIKLYTPSGEEVKLNEPVGDGYEVEQVAMTVILPNWCLLTLTISRKGNLKEWWCIPFLTYRGKGL